MKLKDFFRDRIMYTVVYFAGISLTIIIMYLTIIINKKEFPSENVLYAFLVSIVFFVIFIIHDYQKNKLFYKQLESMLKAKDSLEHILNIGNIRTGEQKIYKELLANIYKLHNEKLAKYE